MNRNCLLIIAWLLCIKSLVRMMNEQNQIEVRTPLPIVATTPFQLQPVLTAHGMQPTWNLTLQSRHDPAFN